MASLANKVGVVTGGGTGIGTTPPSSSVQLIGIARNAEEVTGTGRPTVIGSSGLPVSARRDRHRVIR
jgi:hypothetical protein